MRKNSRAKNAERRITDAITSLSSQSERAKNAIHWFGVYSTSSPGPSPRSKWRSDKPLAKAAEILQESWSILSRDTWWNGFFGGWLQRLAALFVFLQSEMSFKRNEYISKYLRDKILTNFWSHFGSLGQGFLRPPFWTRRRPWARGWVNKLCWTPIYWMSHQLLLAMIVEMESMEVSRKRSREIDFFPPFPQWSGGNLWSAWWPGSPRSTSLSLH